ncbi:MAG: Ig-like domain-containing protein [Candidatus Woesearchaeota archaeon]
MYYYLKLINRRNSIIVLLMLFVGLLISSQITIAAPESWLYTPGLYGVQLTCNNTVQDGFEEGVDCGGACDGCSPVAAGSVDIYYISNSTGNDSWDGMAPSWNGTSGPWKTLDKLHSSWNLIGPGDYVLFKRGDMWRPSSNPPSAGGLIQPPPNKAGNRTHYITLGAYGTGAKPIISAGAKPIDGSGNRYIINLAQGDGLSYFIFQDIEFRGVFWFVTGFTESPISETANYSHLKFLRIKIDGNATGDADAGGSMWFWATGEKPVTFNPETYWPIANMHDIEIAYSIFNNTKNADAIGIGGQGNVSIHHNELYNNMGHPSEDSGGESIDFHEGKNVSVEYNIISGSAGYNLKIQKHGHWLDYCTVRGNLFMGSDMNPIGFTPMAAIGVRWCVFEDNTFVMNLGNMWGWNAGFDGHVNPVFPPDTMDQYGIYGNVIRNNIFYGRGAPMFVHRSIDITYRNGSTITYNLDDIWTNNRFENNTYYDYHYPGAPGIHVREYISPSGMEWVEDRDVNRGYDNAPADWYNYKLSDYWIASDDFDSLWLSKPNVSGDLMEDPELINPSWTNSWNYGNYRVQNGSTSYGRGAWAAVDRAGAVISNAPPTVSITYPVSGDNFTAGSTIQVNATASDSDGSVLRVEFYRNTTLLFNDTISPYSANWTNAQVGAYSLIARAVDNNGSRVSSSAILVSVRPTYSFNITINNSNITLTNYTIINNASVQGFQNVSNMTFGNAFGRIRFLRNLLFYRNISLNINNLQIDSRRIYINSTNLPEFDEEAQLEFYNITYAYPQPYRDGVMCTSECSGESYNTTANSYSMIVSGFSEYTILDASCGDGVCNGAEVCDVCEADCGECDTGGSGGNGGGGGGGGSGYVPPAILKNDTNATINATNTLNSSIVQNSTTQASNNTNSSMQQYLNAADLLNNNTSLINEKDSENTLLSIIKSNQWYLISGIIIIIIFILILLFIIERKKHMHSELIAANHTSETHTDLWNKYFEYVKKAREKYTDDQIKSKLKNAGWNDAQIELLFRKIK